MYGEAELPVNCKYWLLRFDYTHFFGKMSENDLRDCSGKMLSKKIIPDDYAKNGDGIHYDDTWAAYLHAGQCLAQFRLHPSKQMADSVGVDFYNCFVSMVNSVGFYEQMLVEMVETMAFYGMSDSIIYYSYEALNYLFNAQKNIGDGGNAAVRALGDVFARIGDRYLFQMMEANTAREFYRLVYRCADLIIDYSKKELAAFRSDKERDIIDSLPTIERITAGLSLYENDTTFADFFNEHMTKQYHYEDIGEACKASDYFFDELMMNYQNCDRKTARVLAFMSLRAIDLFMRPVLYNLHMDNTVFEKMHDNVCRVMSQLDDSFVEATDNGDGNKVKDYMKVKLYADFIVDELRLREDERLCYYTSLKNFSYMMPDHCGSEDFDRLAVMNVTNMNDPSEGNTVFDYLYGIRKNVKRVHHRISIPYVFLKCFTTNIDSLAMWGMYGDNAHGICAVIDSSKAADLGQLYHVCYIDLISDKTPVKQTDNTTIPDESRKRINEWVRKIRSMVARRGLNHMWRVEMIKRFMSRCRYLFKEKSYAYENEVRLIYSFENYDSSFQFTRSEMPRLFIKTKNRVPINRVILGPGMTDIQIIAAYLQASFDAMQQVSDIRPVIEKSAIEYR